MKFIPILFSTPMVQAILDGRKTQTRRVMKMQPTDDHYQGSFGKTLDGKDEKIFLWHRIPKEGDTMGSVDSVRCPYGQPGDVLWVRESWTENGLGYYRYSADYTEPSKALFDGKSVPEKLRNKWKPSIHMPKSACRIWLRVKSVKAERLQDISVQEAIAEGVRFVTHWKTQKPFYLDYSYYTANALSDCGGFHNPKDSFHSLWATINGQESWPSNPWVWVVEFERIDKPTNF